MAGTITALKRQKNNKERVNVYLDGRYAFAVTALAAAHLRQEQFLSDAEITGLKKKDELERAYQSAVRFLGNRPRSQQEVFDRLQRKGLLPAVIETTIARLLREKYLDDVEFARYWIENRERFKPRSRRALRYELRQKGIAETIIEEALADLDEEESAWQAIAQRLHRWQGLDENDFRQKAGGYLARRGFSYSIIKPVLGRAWASLQAEQP
ncbi:MAG: regulatory protein RecX [Anaerolineae bacterium]